MLTTGKKESMATDRQNPIAFVRAETGFWTSIVCGAETSGLNFVCPEFSQMFHLQQSGFQKEIYIWYFVFFSA